MALRDRQMHVPGGPGEPAPPPSTEPEQPERTLWVSWVLLIGSVGWFVAQLFLVYSGQEETMPSFALHGPSVQDGDWWRVLMMAFEHGGPIHLVFNMSAVWTLGRVLESGVGSFRMLITSVVGALGSSCFALLVDWEQRTVGCSGVILAWGGAILPIATKHGRQTVGIWLAQVAVISLLPGISWAGHLGGFLFGIPCGWAMRGKRDRFGVLAPVLLFVAAVLTFLVGSGKVAY